MDFFIHFYSTKIRVFMLISFMVYSIYQKNNNENA